jgi:hypothetical protein
MNDEMPITYYRMGKERIKVREPKQLTAGLVVSDEAFLVIDTNAMRMEFQRQLFKHIQDGNIKVQVAEVEYD